MSETKPEEAEAPTQIPSLFTQNSPSDKSKSQPRDPRKREQRSSDSSEEDYHQNLKKHKQ